MATRLIARQYKRNVQLAMLCINKNWTTMREHTHKMLVAEMPMLRWISAKARKDNNNWEDKEISKDNSGKGFN